MTKIAFIGAGNMALSLIGGLLRDGIDPADVTASDPDPGQRARVSELGISTTNDNAEAIGGAQTVVLAVKPQVAESVLTPLKKGLHADQLLISIAAGISIAALEQWSGGGAAIVRCMPNTPALYGTGITVACAGKGVTKTQQRAVDALMQAAGTGLWVEDESQLDAVTAVSGSGPAYFFYLMEVMIDAGTDLGLPREVARQLTLHTALGAATMAMRSEDPPATLRRNVTSPGGTTERAVSIFEAAGLRETITRGVTGAAERSAELAGELAGPHTTT